MTVPLRLTRPGIIENAEEVLKNNDLQILKRDLLHIVAEYATSADGINKEGIAEAFLLYQDICDLMEAAHLLLTSPPPPQ